jgi:hypothetical protein
MAGILPHDLGELIPLRLLRGRDVQLCAQILDAGLNPGLDGIISRREQI